MAKFFLIWLLATVLLTMAPLAEAQQPKKVPRIGYLSSRLGIESRERAFLNALRELGVEGQNISIEWRFAKGEEKLLTTLAAELVRLKVDCIVASETAATLAVKHATSALPIVMINVGDAIERGFVASLARPGGNITGLTSLSPELSDKRLELLKEAFPKLSKIAVLWDPSRLGTDAHVKETEIAARALGLHLKTVEVRRGADIDAAFQAAQKERLEAFMVLGAGFFCELPSTDHQSRIKYRSPVMYSDPGFVLAGGLMSYAVEQFHRAATYVDKILKGTKPTDLPVEQPRKFELLINLKAAKQIGVTIPPELLARANRLIK